MGAKGSMSVGHLLNGIAGENRSTRKIICLSDTLSLTNHTWTGPFSTPGLRGESRR
jgi:hypothetical protein